RAFHFRRNPPSLGTSLNALIFSPKTLRYFRRNCLCIRAGIWLCFVGSFDRFRFDSSRLQRLRHVHGYSN
ncbi:hypothetical protein LINPERPRIM_LOCUS22416, partial [Linum perenne]